VGNFSQIDSGGVRQSGTRRYYLSDANYNVTAMANERGSVVERYVYTPYGETTFCAPDWSTRS
jgi:hypothetical protein